MTTYEVNPIGIIRCSEEGFFLRRPIFSTVISLIITLVGAIAISVLPVEQYPDLTPPQVEVNATYTGASANVIAETVASLLESQINGVDNMIYMNSVSSGTGSISLTVSFNVGTDPDQATIDVNNRVQLALAQLPQEVQRMGVSVLKKSSSMLQIIFLTSPDQRYNTIYLSNYALLNIVDELKRLPGVGDAKNFAAQDYSMRVWLKPDVMSQLGVTPEDIATALRDQNAQFAAGRMGAEPMSPGVGVTWQITTQGRLTTPEQFGDVILRTQPDGSILRLKDVATIELGAQSYDFVGKYNGLDAVPIGIYLSPGANALATAEVVKAKMEELSKEFPVGVAYSIPYDTTTFVKISIEEVVKTLFEAMVLVFLVVYLFLQNWRATLIPCLAVPVSIVGTFAGMYALGFSINTLTMFGLVLAIGIVVDDAIVVLENVERHISDGLPPRKATAKAMQEVTGPVIAIVLVLCAVFIPVAFTGGMAGRMYQQFAITIAVSVVISGAVALTFTPALCALLLKHGHGEPNVFFRKFNEWFEGLTGKYVSIVKLLLRRSLLAVGLFVLVLVGIGGVFERVPGGLVPDEDQGYLIALMTMPDGAAISRTSEVRTGTRPSSIWLILPCEQSRCAATSRWVRPAASRSLRSSPPRRRRCTVGLLRTPRLLGLGGTGLRNVVAAHGHDDRTRRSGHRVLRPTINTSVAVSGPVRSSPWHCDHELTLRRTRSPLHLNGAVANPVRTPPRGRRGGVRGSSGLSCSACCRSR